MGLTAVNKKIILWVYLWVGYACWALAGDTVHQTLFIIEKLPENTPHDASIYLASDLDGWVTDLPGRKFEKQLNGELELLLKHRQDTIEYKLTRGTWDAVEARENGRARPNRFFIATRPFEEVRIKVDSWEDISYHPYTVYMFFLLVASIQGILLVVAINTIRNKNKVANSLLSVLLILITVSLLGRASTFDPDVFNWQPKLLFVPELILFTYGPLFYLYIHKLLVIPFRWKFGWLHFLPAIGQLALYLPYLPMERQTFIFRVLDKELFPYFAITGVLALFFNTLYWWLSWRLIFKYRAQDQLSEKQKRYVWFLRGILRIKAVYLGLWVLVVGIYLTGRIAGQDLLYLSENLIDILWLLFSLIIFALAYYAVKHPEVLRDKKKYRDHEMKPDEVAQIMQKLKYLLHEEKVFTQPDLTLERLAHKIPTATHTLSQVINEQYQQSFTDLINSHRVDEFVQQVNASGSRSYLEIALSVGFNSKPTFNRAFKKIKGQTPRAFFRITK